MKLYKLCEQLDKILLKKVAYEWDNVGLLVGELEKDVKNITLTLELNDKVIDDAIDNNSNLIISHHPLIFSGIKNVVDNDINQKMIIKLIKNNIAFYTAHTNFDLLNGGLNDYVINLLDVNNVQTLEDNEQDNSLGRVATLKKEFCIKDFAKYVKQRLKADELRYIGNDDNKIIKTVALVTGAGADFIDMAKVKADVFITGDMKYHDAQDTYKQGYFVIDAGHYATEQHFTFAMKNFLEQNLTEKFDIFISNSLVNPFKMVED